MTIKQFLLCAMEYRPISESIAYKILKRILLLLGYGPPKELPEPQEQIP